MMRFTRTGYYRETLEVVRRTHPGGSRRFTTFCNCNRKTIAVAFSEFEQRRIAKIVGGYVDSRRPPPQIRNELDLAFLIDKQSVILYEIRQIMGGSHVERPFAKATWVKTQQHWRIFWQRANLKWHSYEPLPEVGRLEDFVKEVERDPYCCFYG